MISCDTGVGWSSRELSKPSWLDVGVKVGVKTLSLEEKSRAEYSLEVRDS